MNVGLTLGMARPRQKLDRHHAAAAVARRLKQEPAGWKRERLMAVALGWGRRAEPRANRPRGAPGALDDPGVVCALPQGGVEALLRDERAENPGATGLLHEQALRELEAGLQKGQWRTGPQWRRWMREVHGIEAALPAI